MPDRNARRDVAILVGCFVVSRIVLHVIGVHFYSEFIYRLWQSIDVPLLRNDLLRSLYYSHAQPPLFNLFCGLVLKLFPNNFAVVFHLLFYAITMTTSIVLYFMIRRLNVRPAFALVAALYFMLCPSVILYENLFSYSTTVVLLITTAVFAFLKFVQTHRLVTWGLFWVLMSMLALTRATFHLGWLMIMLAFLGTLLWYHGRRITWRYYVAALVPLAMVFIWYLKNFMVFGSFTASTWLGMNLARVMPPETVMGQIGSFRAITEYQVETPDARFPGVPVLHEQRKVKGFINFYHIDYIRVSNEFRKEVLTSIEENPGRYFQRVGEAIVIYFSPSTHGPFIDKNYRHFAGYGAMVNLDFSGYDHFVKDDFPMLGAVPVFFIFVFIAIFILFARYQRLLSTDDLIITAFLFFLCLSNMLVGCMFEYGENNRFRFEIISVLLMLAARTAELIRGYFMVRF